MWLVVHKHSLSRPYICQCPIQIYHGSHMHKMLIIYCYTYYLCALYVCILYMYTINWGWNAGNFCCFLVLVVYSVSCFSCSVGSWKLYKYMSCCRFCTCRMVKVSHKSRPGVWLRVTRQLVLKPTKFHSQMNYACTHALDIHLSSQTLCCRVVLSCRAWTPLVLRE